MSNLLKDIDFDYSLLGDDDEDINENGAFLSEVPLTLLENSIEIQFQEPLEYRKKDYIQDFIDKYEYSKAFETERDPQFTEELHDEFIEFISKAFHKYVGISFVDIENLDDEDQHELIHNAYLFFIKAIKKNFVQIVCNELKENKDEYLDGLELREDVSYNTFKIEIDNDDDIAILTNLNIVVENVLSKIRRTYDVETFFTMCDYGEVNLPMEFIKEAYDEYKITGNFVINYTEMVDDIDFKYEIETKVRNFILKKYPNRKTIEKALEEEKDQ